MSKKSKATNDELAATVRKSANQIFLAGLGAFNKTQEEGTKVFDALVKEGTKVFDGLVKEAGAVQKRATGLADSKMAEMKAAAAGTWSTLETVFEDRVARVLHGLNVATKKDVDALARRVSQLGGKKPSAGSRRVAKSASRRLTRKSKVA
jgi:poly(hydroxyalkanoate) granule-associated protein